MKNQKKIRIIGGKWKRQKIKVIPNKNIRPTTDRMRETLFNWLNNKIVGSKCLDCYAGSGILSLEAISRNANFVTLLDSKYDIYKNLKKIFFKFSIKNKLIVCTDTFSWLKKKITLMI